MIWSKKTILFWVLCFAFGASQAQKSAVEVDFSSGKILNIYPDFPERDAHRIVGLTYQWQRNTAYSANYGFAQNAFKLTLHDFGNPNVLGYGIGLQYELRLHQNLTKRWRMIEHIGLGGIFNSKPYHYLSNQENIVMSSPVAALISAAYGFEYHAFDRFYISTEGVFWHSSNMHTSLPNVGLNTPAIRVAMRYAISAEVPQDQFAERLSLKNTWGIQARLAIGYNQAGGTARPVNTPLYWKQLAAIGMSYRFKSIHRISLDLEAYYDGANRVWNESLDRTLDHPAWESSVVVLMLGHEFTYGHFGFIVNAGLNVHNPTYTYLLENGFDNVSRVNIKKYIPGRVAMRYYFNLAERNKTSTFLQFGVKSHFTQADFLEFGIGMLISKPQPKSE